VDTKFAQTKIRTTSARTNLPTWKWWRRKIKYWISLSYSRSWPRFSCHVFYFHTSVTTRLGKPNSGATRKRSGTAKRTAFKSQCGSKNTALSLQNTKSQDLIHNTRQEAVSVGKLSRNSLALTEIEYSLLSSAQSATGPHPQPDKSNPYPNNPVS
jgi:hypothetical protein